MKSMNTVFYCLLIVPVFVQAMPDLNDDIEYQKGAIAAAVRTGQWDKVEKIVAEALIRKVEDENIAMENQKNGFQLLRQNVDSLKPPQGGHVYGESNFQYQRSTNNGGLVHKQSGGHKIINNDGKVVEYKFRK